MQLEVLSATCVRVICIFEGWHVYFLDFAEIGTLKPLIESGCGLVAALLQPQILIT
jgi:hypothetical protein